MIERSATPHPPQLFTVAQFAEAFPAFSPASLRALIFDSEPRYRVVGARRITIPENGFRPAFVRLGRRVLIDAPRFFEIIRDRNAPRSTEGFRRGRAR